LKLGRPKNTIHYSLTTAKTQLTTTLKIVKTCWNDCKSYSI